MVEARRRRSAEERQRIMNEAVEAGTSIAEVARHHGMNANLLFRWLREAGHGRQARERSPDGVVIDMAKPLEFVSLGVFSRDDEAGSAVTLSVPKAPTPSPAVFSHPGLRAAPRLEERAGVIEMELPGGRAGSCRCLCERAGATPGAAGDEGGLVISFAPGTKVYLACRPMSMRKGFDGLSAEVASVLNQDPYSGHVFIFRSSRADYLKILHWDGSSLCPYAKRLETGRFVWPPIVEGAMTLTPAQMALLIEAIDWRRTVAHDPPPRPALI